MSSKITLQQLLEAGCHFGHQVKRWNPAMKKYIYDSRDGVHIFDLVQTKAGLDAACDFLSSITKEDKKVLFVGTKRQAKDFVKAQAIRVGQPYVVERWLGGMLTNFDQVQKSINRLKTLKAQRLSGELKKYTKKEQLDFDREIAKGEKFFGGVADMAHLPAAMFVVDVRQEEVAVREARRLKIPVIGMVDSNGDPDLVDYVIPTNDDAAKAIELIVKTVADAIGTSKGSKESTTSTSSN